uniref:Uncharacterized protein n=1 Tax=Acrobeloides nanus TaxID=290746 RepID=A0A914E7G1_9BILA
MIITIFGNIKENYKWIVFHSSTTTLLLTIIFEIQSHVPPQTPVDQITPAYFYISHMCSGSLLPLAINRKALNENEDEESEENENIEESDGEYEDIEEDNLGELKALPNDLIAFILSRQRLY